MGAPAVRLPGALAHAGALAAAAGAPAAGAGCWVCAVGLLAAAAMELALGTGAQTMARAARQPELARMLACLLPCARARHLSADGAAPGFSASASQPPAAGTPAAAQPGGAAAPGPPLQPRARPGLSCARACARGGGADCSQVQSRGARGALGPAGSARAAGQQSLAEAEPVAPSACAACAAMWVESAGGPDPVRSQASCERAAACATWVQSAWRLRGMAGPRPASGCPPHSKLASATSKFARAASACAGQAPLCVPRAARRAQIRRRWSVTARQGCIQAQPWARARLGQGSPEPMRCIQAQLCAGCFVRSLQ